MEDDATKKAAQFDEPHPAADKIEELPEQPVSDHDAESIKGGRARRGGDDSPTE